MRTSCVALLSCQATVCSLYTLGKWMNEWKIVKLSLIWNWNWKWVGPTDRDWKNNVELKSGLRALGPIHRKTLIKSNELNMKLTQWICLVRCLRTNKYSTSYLCRCCWSFTGLAIGADLCEMINWPSTLFLLANATMGETRHSSMSLNRFLPRINSDKLGNRYDHVCPSVCLLRCDIIFSTKRRTMTRFHQTVVKSNDSSFSMHFIS